MSNTFGSGVILVVGVCGVALIDESTVGVCSFGETCSAFNELSCLSVDVSVPSDKPFIFSTALLKLARLSDDDDSLPENIQNEKVLIVINWINIYGIMYANKPVTDVERSVDLSWMVLE